MRHKVFGKKLNRDVKERKALFKSLIISLISYGRIKTSLAKAKAIQRITEKLVTKVKDGQADAYRQVSSFLTQKEPINKLIKEIGPRFKNIQGGYLRVRRTGKRKGDATQEVILEWSKAEEKKEKVKPVKLEEKKNVKDSAPEKKTDKKRTKTSAKG